MGKCKCVCHKPKFQTAIYEDGLVHDSWCCDKLNGSLKAFAVNDLINEYRIKELENLFERIYPHNGQFALASETTIQRRITELKNPGKQGCEKLL